MGTATFDRFILDKQAATAERTYGPLATTQQGQKQILQDASEGNTVAANYLFNVYKRIIAKAFWNYYLGPNKRFHRQRLSAGADSDFAATAYEMLLGSTDPSPYATFNPDKFNKKADLIKQFGYYLYRYLQNEAFKMLRADKLGGMTGNIKTGDDAKTVSYDDHYADSEDASVESHTDNIDLQETVKAFIKHLRSIKPIYSEVFKKRLSGKSITETAQELGITDQSVRNHLKAIKDLYDKFVN